MLETAVFWAPRPIKPGRHPLQRVITRPRPNPDSLSTASLTSELKCWPLKASGPTPTSNTRC